MDAGIIRVFKDHEEKLRINAKIIGLHIYHYRSLESTNDLAFSLALKGLSEGSIIVSDRQTKGKGRLGRKWYSPKGGLYFSVILRPKDSFLRLSLVTILSAVSVSSVLRRLGIDAWIKWPNDIMVGNKKICGILVEMDSTIDRVKFVIAGVGINNQVNAVDLVHTATSIYEETAKRLSNKELLRLSSEELDKNYAVFLKGNYSLLIDKLKSLSRMVDKKVVLRISSKEYKGKVKGFGADGSLMVTVNKKTRKFLSVDKLRIIE
ncbi:MAG: biotin--[acetyl-CoA-carboxylase] ligase [Candidatus Gygaella obscura]|nr:biotin--[acetyl-CoA-carboxylase] ligase [Candidatus Gygaella obscura]